MTSKQNQEEILQEEYDNAKDTGNNHPVSARWEPSTSRMTIDCPTTLSQSTLRPTPQKASLLMKFTSWGSRK